MKPVSPRSYLFVPANRPERFPKAHASGADIVIHDLEDAVAEADKAKARWLLREYFHEGGTGMVRINSAHTPWFSDDLELCRHKGVQGVILPKAEYDYQVAMVVRHLRPGVSVLPLIESAVGMENIKEIAAAPAVARLLFGTVDFCSEMGIEGDDLELLYFRSRIVLASRVAGIGSPVDGVSVGISDMEALRAASIRGMRLGFGAKLCIHPSQVAVVNEAYRPSAEIIAWAEQVVENARHRPGAFQLNGQMIDAPVVARAMALLSQAGRVAA